MAVVQPRAASKNHFVMDDPVHINERSIYPHCTLVSPRKLFSVYGSKATALAVGSRATTCCFDGSSSFPIFGGRRRPHFGLYSCLIKKTLTCNIFRQKTRENVKLLCVKNIAFRCIQWTKNLTSRFFWELQFPIFHLYWKLFTI